MPPLRFGHALQLHRIRAGLSLSGLSDLVHFSPSYLSRVESGDRTPSPQLARLCDTALGADGELADLLAPRVPRAAPTSAADKSPRAVPSSPRTEGAPGSGQPAPAVCPVALPAVDDGEDVRSVAHFTGHLGELRRLAQRVSPTPVLRQAGGAISLLESLAPAARTPAARDQYLELLAFYCEFAGWMAQESGNHTEAERWIGRTETLATEAGAHDLADHTLIRRAGLALYQGNAESVVEYAAEAGRRGHGSPRIRALAAFREAQGLALAGRGKLCAAALDRAGELLDATAGTAAITVTAARPSEGSRSRSPALVIGSDLAVRLGGPVGGWCLYDLGRPDEAAEVIRDGLGQLPHRAARMRALFTARLALSLADAGELDAVVPVVDGLLKDSEGLCSDAVRTQLRQLAISLRRRHTRPAMRELRARVTAALSCTGCVTPS
ncbi:helix-turn-helix domain-containing protein [Streptomyces sp. MBT65]|uniref:helix-turn-helix domain-containing protein n=1 Tax=Streptomyces sp. MBT65 TaxID=1488395 RepID=UPI00190A3F51|nr:helix-turn-helix transcriptional regulator [Streptomyces sp. MBT65]MBK3577823.1 helix-turn-helix domain-containing protein [Streptomyces sp. MBT65]